VTRPRAFTPSAETTREVPAHSGARLDRIDAAVTSLRAEARRLARLGLGAAEKQCLQQLRYWEFLRALFTVADAPEEPRFREEPRRWRVVPGR